jgi:hypothetical protein
MNRLWTRDVRPVLANVVSILVHKEQVKAHCFDRRIEEEGEDGGVNVGERLTVGGR